MWSGEMRHGAPRVVVGERRRGAPRVVVGERRRGAPRVEVGERRRGAPRVVVRERGFVVGGTGLEPVTSAMSTLRSSQLS